jgi:hypothetical protein
VRAATVSGLLLALVGGCGRLSFEGAGSRDAAPVVDDVVADDNEMSTGCFVPGVTLLCDDFEIPGFGGWQAVVGDLTRVTTPTRSGSGAMRASVQPPQTAWLGFSPADLSTHGRLAIRFWQWIPSAASMEHINFVTLQDTASLEEISVHAFGDDLSVWRDMPPARGYRGPMLPRDRWHCVELEIVVDDTNGSLVLRLDGAQVAFDSAIDTRPTTAGFNHISIGLPWTDFANQGAATVYYDDVHIGTAAVGCGP